MKNEVLEELAGVRGAPAVSILCPLDVQRAGNHSDLEVLATLRSRAAAEVRAIATDSAASSTMSRVDDALASLDLQHPTPAVAVFVNPDVSRVVRLGETIEPEVVVGERFAIRGVLAALLRSPHARAIALWQTGARCIDLNGNAVTERRDFDFPLELQPPVEADTPHRDFPLSEHAHAEAAKFVLRAVENALSAVQRHDERRLVVLGAERDLAYFLELTDQVSNVVGCVRGNYEHETPAAIAASALHVLAAHQHEEERRAGDEVRDAIGRHAVSGITDTWTAARRGRGYRLVVEDTFRYQAHVNGDTLEAAPSDEADTCDAVEDTIQEVIRHGGDVVVVSPDSLSDLGRIALLTRY